MSSNDATVVNRATSPETEQPAEEAEGATQVELQRTEDVAEELSLDIIFEVLKNQRRRHVLRYLEEREEVVRLGELAEYVAAKENDTTVKALTSAERKRVYVGLYQCHLPKMDDMGIVRFNRDRGRIELTERASQLDPYLEKTEERGIAWHGYYLGLAAMGGGLFALAALGGVPLGISPTVALGVVVAAFALCSGIHAGYEFLNGQE